MSNMSLNRSLTWGLALALIATVAILLVGFVAGANFKIPGVVEMSSSSDGRPASEFFFNPLAPLAVAVVLGLLIWSAGRARSRGE